MKGLRRDADARRGRDRPGAAPPAAPDLRARETADGVPYWKIALMHLDSLASTVFQRCVYWAPTSSALRHRHQPPGGCTVAVKTPATSRRSPRGRPAGRRQGRHPDDRRRTATTAAPPTARCAQAIRDASGLPVQVQIEPPSDFGAASPQGERRRGACSTLEVWDEDGSRRVPCRASTPRAGTTTSRRGGGRPDLRTRPGLHLLHPRAR